MHHDPLPKVYIVLTNWNGYRDSIECLESLFRLTYDNYVVLVCDNDSTDGSLQHLRHWAEGTEPYLPPENDLRLLTEPAVAKPIQYRVLRAGRGKCFPRCREQLVMIQTGGNLGFAGGNNVGIRFAIEQGDCDFIWFLNNDTVVSPDTLDLLVERALDDSSVGMVGATICYYNDPHMLQAFGGATFRKFRARSGLIGIGCRLSEMGGTDPRWVESRLDWVSGASMLVSARFIDVVGLMDERYFLYFEELDWALRAKGHFRTAYAPKALLYHKHGSSTKEGSRSDTAVYFRCRSRLKLYRKLLPPYLPFCLIATVKDAALHAVKGRLSALKPMWRAVMDELGEGPGRCTEAEKPQLVGVSVIIKALNEERYIEGAIRSALEAIAIVGGEVILADSGSTDRTVEIARRFPITIVQLADRRDATCGIGPQLGFQAAKGEFVYILDGDMTLMPGFLEAAMAEFRRNPSLAGIGGMLCQSGDMNAEFRLRQHMVSEVRATGPVSHLGGGGMYRTSAVRSVGYLSNRNLHSFEELELGVRLVAAGWRLIRLPVPGIHHYPHQRSASAQLISRLQGRRFFGPGEFFRSALGKRYFTQILPRFRFIYFTAAWLFTLLVCCLLPVAWQQKLFMGGLLFLLPFALMVLRYRDVGSGVYCVSIWLCGLFGAVCGFLRTPVDPSAPIDSFLVKQGEWFTRRGRTNCRNPENAGDVLTTAM